MQIVSPACVLHSRNSLANSIASLAGLISSGRMDVSRRLSMVQVIVINIATFCNGQADEPGLHALNR